MIRDMEEERTNGIDPLIFNYLQGNASKEEIETLDSWLSESIENLTYYKQLRNIWESSVDLPVSTEKALSKVIKQIIPENKAITFWHFWQKIAAVLLFPLLLSLAWFSIARNAENRRMESTFNIATAAFGSYSSLELPDGSKVWLNSGSRLKYPLRFSDHNRQVYLNGEAYFEVHSDATSPFFVNTPYFAVKATGTCFNVTSYKNILTPSVTLVEGKVSVQEVSQGRKNETLAILHPGQHMEYDTLLRKTIILTEDTYKYVAWKDGKLVFRNDLLSEVARRISLQYNVDIEVIGNRINKNRYRATFENQPLNELLELLKMSAPIDYKEINPERLPDNSFSKRKIIIYSTNR
jgi:transmembrane sensor